MLHCSITDPCRQGVLPGERLLGVSRRSACPFAGENSVFCVLSLLETIRSFYPKPSSHGKLKASSGLRSAQVNWISHRPSWTKWTDPLGELPLAFLGLGILLLLFLENHRHLAQAELGALLTLLIDLPFILSILVDLKEMKRNILALKHFFMWISYLNGGGGGWPSKSLEISLKLCIKSCLYSHVYLFF